ncbi:MAG: type II toxin-antitoxin system HicA family toxin [Thermoanaerobaculia bacterium]|nr:type II toxin-antitoxin system HicA family toxin [Thermoanaerobaculia bacterium]
MRPDRLFARLRSGALGNVAFDDLERLMEALGFERRRVRGSHRVYVHPRVPAILSLQPVGGRAKPYQLRQLLRLLAAYNLDLDSDR